MDKQQIKAAVCAAIDQNRDKLIALGKDIFSHPELGYKETRTSSLVQRTFEELGLPYQNELALTGVKARAAGRDHRATVAVMGELDAVVSPLHPNADKQTGAAHACGHNAQITTMLGAAMGLCLSGAMEQLDGDAVFMAVPAEEFVELEYREKLLRDGKIEFLGGKQQLIAEGAFDDVDMAMMVHSMPGAPTPQFTAVGAGCSGFVGKLVKYRGKEAHAGAAPHDGINALNAACLGLMGINAQRETFKDEDGIRVHPIITKGGDLVNIVPADVRIETYVRGRGIDAIVDASKKVDWALRGGAMAVGAEVEIVQLPGYLPIDTNRQMDALFMQNAAALVGEKNVVDASAMPAGGGSSDVGDLSLVIPTIQPVAGGFSGTAHAMDFLVCDEEMAYINPAKMMACTVVDLLCDGAEAACQVKAEYKPTYTKETYLAFWREFVKAQ
ncbi:amidohydrolase [Bittarella massiliensis (ex Durand et al. 2017)]|uniref:Peptidase M20 domain-containing protein 2 n=2 Tax=Eubacteriales TaxID=186802 RepID=A0ABW9WSN4_9FIRM|nr:amidohydrolase [Bittarella massiliensis (ex Durand et al. 2017)]MZL68218.1 amidohydrolase [Bittarella massiliensis (ex Durand et al. 2017)]MZL79727.1 amidohydrolase [Bittarella massiliensis (ex Durand et al. 2017)]